jgi:hypothetical protein
MTSLAGSIASLCLILLKTKLAAKCGERWYYYVSLSVLLLFLVPLHINLPALYQECSVLKQSGIRRQGP